MTDKEILEEVHRRLQGMASVNAQPIADFIEQEWQKKDEKEREQQSKSLGQFSKSWYTDVRDMERHRGLEIGPDGTVTGVK